MESCCTGNCLDVIRGAEVGIGPWDCGHSGKFYRLRKTISEVGVLVTAITCVPAGIDCQVHQVSQPPDLLGASRLAARQSAERVEVNGLLPFGHEVCVQERGMAA